ncbi:MAG: type II toxin-antitoxin system RelE/ParE family toxin, partial [Proteobacteria bacterium]|nr:type II toxin-antitoxin system RelE/ParE family toxin [Pseudomonadota bacterium]
VIFIQGYAKNQVSTLKPKELKAVRKAAKEMLNWSDKEVDKLVEQDVLQEINDG